MRLLARIRLSLILVLSVLCFVLPSAADEDDGETCSDANQTGTITCTPRQWCDAGTANGHFFGSCYYPESAETEEKADANVASKAMGREVTVEELRRNTALREGLQRGRIVRDDGKVIMLTPLDRIRSQYQISPYLFRGSAIQLDGTQLDNRFDKVRQTEGIVPAIDGYRNLLKNPMVQIVKPTRHLENVGNELLSANKLPDAIKVLQLSREQRPRAITVILSLADAYARLFQNEGRPDDKDMAIKTYEDVINSRTGSAATKNRAAERLRALRDRP